MRTAPHPPALGFLLTAALAACAACGYKTDPRPPEDTAAVLPAAIETRTHDGAVVVAWHRPTQSADGRALYDLAGFLVERDEGDGFELAGTIEVDDLEQVRPRSSFSFTDPSPPAGRLRYRVRPYTADGQKGVASLPAAIEVGAN